MATKHYAADGHTSGRARCGAHACYVSTTSAPSLVECARCQGAVRLIARSLDRLGVGLGTGPRVCPVDGEISHRSRCWRCGQEVR